MVVGIIIIVCMAILVIANIYASFKSHPVIGVISIIVNVVLFAINPLLTSFYMAISYIIILARKKKRR